MRYFNDIKSTVESVYPLPIAHAFRRFRIADPNDLGGRHKLIIDLFELLVKFLCIVQLKEGLNKSANYIDKLPNREKTLEFLKRPSLGGWLGLMRSLCLIASENDNLKIGRTIHDWYFSQADEESAHIMGLLNNLGDISYNKKNRKHKQELTNALVKYRNKNIGHGVHSNKDVLKERLDILEQVLAYIIDSATFLSEINLVVVEGVVLSEGNKWQINCQELRGLTLEPFQFHADKPLNLNEVYLIDDINASESLVSSISLEPFAIWKFNEQQKQNEVYLYSSSWKTKLEYISYSSGEYYFHKELHVEFRKLLSLELADGLEEQGLEDLSQEKKTSLSHDFLKKGLALAQYGKLEDAIAYLEQSVLYDRRPETFVELARLHHQLGDSEETIQHIIQQCLDIDPDNSMALDFLEKLKRHDSKKKRKRITDDDSKNEFFTIYDAVFPPGFRPYVFPLITVAIILVAGAFGYYEYTYTAESLTFVLYIAGLFLIPPIWINMNTPKKMEGIRLPLSLQISSMRLDRFNIWYSYQIQDICGKFIYKKNGTIDILESIKSERVFLLIMLPFLIVFSPLIFYSIESHLLPKNIQIIRWIVSVGSAVVVYLGIRYVYTITIFVLRFSSLPLKPLVSSLNNDGFRSLGSFLISLITTMMLLFIAIWISLGLVLQGEPGIDLIALFISIILVFVWSVGLPFSLYRAGKEAKNQISHRYSIHLEGALEKFVDDPGENTLSNYEWLIKQQRVIKKIPCWPLSFFQTIVVAILNVLLAIVAYAYIYIRF